MCSAGRSSLLASLRAWVPYLGPVKLSVTRQLLWLLAAGAAFVLPAAAEEFHLKDGTKIVGQVIGYDEEKSAFRVETSFGLAIIYKDRIARIVFPESARPEEPESETPAPAEETPKPEPMGPGRPREEPGPAANEANTRPESSLEETPAGDALAAAVSSPEPRIQILEHVTTTRYVNETFRFHLFKPPTWRSYPQLVQPDTPLVAALGTPDETTLMLIGQETFPGDLNEYARQAEASLQRTYDDYRPDPQQRTSVAGQAAIARTFTGQAEGRLWAGKAVYFARGRQYYTLLALTAAGEATPLQQAVLRKVIDSLTFYE